MQLLLKSTLVHAILATVGELVELCRDGLRVVWPSGRRVWTSVSSLAGLQEAEADADVQRPAPPAPPTDQPGEVLASALEELADLERDGFKVSWK